MSSFGGCMWDVNDVTVWPGSSTSPPSDPRRGTVWYGLAANGLAANGLAANHLLRVCRRSDFIYTKNSAIGRSDFIYTKNSARLRYDFIYTKSFERKIVKNQWYSQTFSALRAAICWEFLKKNHDKSMICLKIFPRWARQFVNNFS